MAVAETSKAAFKNVKLGQRQISVYLALKALGRATDLEIANYLEKPINEITPRRNELEKLSYVKQDGKKRNPSGNSAKAWVATDPVVEKVLRIMEVGDCEG